MAKMQSRNQLTATKDSNVEIRIK
ncbi:uncharacterized protein G2W53_014091 [Senna tora]|uniref:Uncharacterized protein n=1 Tax=Senna tora TaxID=362788 RepID=A0A834TZV6_9FABA|nr:uncharacterized protein G2W53_014091 [Senna tora]